MPDNNIQGRLAKPALPPRSLSSIAIVASLVRMVSKLLGTRFGMPLEVNVALEEAATAGVDRMTPNIGKVIFQVIDGVETSVAVAACQVAELYHAFVSTLLVKKKVR